MASRTTRRSLLFGALAVPAAIGATWLAVHRPYPSDHTPEGAYVRIAQAVAEERVKDAFPYLEQEAQWASYTIRDMRRRARDRVAATYPEPERARLLAAYREEADCPDGADLFALVAQRRGWTARLRRDLSGVAHVDVAGERATVVTARGTRYSFRRRDNGIWGLTIFTADLLALADRASRDLAVVTSAADDYARAAVTPSGAPPATNPAP